jgi:ankyrin repeat protein
MRLLANGPQVNTMATLLDLGAPLMREDKQGNTAPYHAAAAGQTEALRLLLQRGADVRSRPASGRTAMHAAASTGQLEMMSMLREAGADPNAQDEQGRTPLHWAAEKGQVCWRPTSRKHTHTHIAFSDSHWRRHPKLMQRFAFCPMTLL